MDHTLYLGMMACGLAAAVQAGLPAALPPADGAAVQAPGTAGSHYQCVNPAVQLHAMLARYALQCGDPACPLCHPPASSP